MLIDLTYSDIKRLVQALKVRYTLEKLPEHDIVDLLELEFHLSKHLTEALRQEGYEIKKGKPLIKGPKDDKKT